MLFPLCTVYSLGASTWATPTLSSRIHLRPPSETAFFPFCHINISTRMFPFFYPLNFICNVIINLFVHSFVSTYLPHYIVSMKARKHILHLVMYIPAQPWTPLWVFSNIVKRMENRVERDTN